ncbi:MAG: nucleotidyltransferase family protein, partial [Desulfatitalea sp.]|nr:nucleotidyltransferase family protein [Desulfatitalea sp.]NNK01323.1 nucleotidyltransferase family protein [Desulfatitalea sp.]
MKAFLMAAGRGTRLRPLTDTRPKCLLPIHGKPLLAIWLDLLARHGVSGVMINTHHHANQVERFLTGYVRHRELAIQTVHEPHLLGSGGTLAKNRDFVADDEDFVIAYADNLTNLNLSEMVDIHDKFRSMGGIMTMGLIRAPEPKQCGIVTLAPDARIIRFVEKPDEPESDLANGGIYIANRRIFDYFSNHGVNEGHVLDLGHHILPRLVGHMYG